jgi:hypothetical protein
LYRTGLGVVQDREVAQDREYHTFNMNTRGKIFKGTEAGRAYHIPDLHCHRNDGVV